MTEKPSDLAIRERTELTAFVRAVRSPCQETPAKASEQLERSPCRNIQLDRKAVLRLSSGLPNIV